MGKQLVGASTGSNWTLMEYDAWQGTSLIYVYKYPVHHKATNAGYINERAFIQVYKRHPSTLYRPLLLLMLVVINSFAWDQQ